jgi:hypothetical protein
MINDLLHILIHESEGAAELPYFTDLGTVVSIGDAGAGLATSRKAEIAQEHSL